MTQRIYLSNNTFGGNVPPQSGRSERERAARIIEDAQIFHCWGDKEINGLDVQKALAAAIRSPQGKGRAALSRTSEEA
jgi:hypothetical protein